MTVRKICQMTFPPVEYKRMEWPVLLPQDDRVWLKVSLSSLSLLLSLTLLNLLKLFLSLFVFLDRLLWIAFTLRVRMTTLTLLCLFSGMAVDCVWS